MRCLLDKVTARRILEGLLKITEGRELSDDELFSLDLYDRAEEENLRLFISPPTANVLERLESLPRYSTLIHLFLDRTEVAWPTHYFKRWARRLRDYGFTPEDAAILSLGTFCVGKDAGILGMHFIATYDQPMIQQWALQYTKIRDHLVAMQQNLPDPYRQALLPHVQFPQNIIVRADVGD